MSDCDLVTRVVTHLDVPPSLNRIGTRGSHWPVTTAKARWQTILGCLLLESRLPRDLAHVEASAALTFPTRRRRDSGNYSWFLEKALGDTLVPRWLEDDTHDRFRFTGVTFEGERGPLRTVLTIVGTVA